MANYDVYGLGNALLDIECEVTPEVLQELGIDKGVMTLLDEEAQNKILAHLHGYSTKRSGGGSAANTLIAVSQLGGNAFYSCKVANELPTKTICLGDSVKSGFANVHRIVTDILAIALHENRTLLT